MCVSLDHSIVAHHCGAILLAFFFFSSRRRHTRCSLDWSSDVCSSDLVLDKNCRCSRQIFETARRVLAHNPQLFEKQLSADQESAYEVGAFAFRDEEEEAAWLLEEIGRASCRERV